MILRWTAKNLLHEPGALVASVGSIAAALVLVLLVEGMFAGESERIVAYLREARADVWVMQGGVSNMHMATSLVRGELAERVRSVPGVTSTTPILYVNAFVEVRGEQWFSYVVGLRPTADRGGPWAMVTGRDRPRRGEVIVPDLVAKRAGLRLGDAATVLGRRLTVTGISAGTYSMANSVTFVSYDDLAELLSAPGAASYVLVTAAAGLSPERLAERVRVAVPEVNAMSRDAFVESDRRMAMQMGVDVVQVMTWIAALVAGLIVAFTTHAATVQRGRELGVAKALGVRTPMLAATVVVHAFVVSVLGCGTALVIAHTARPIIERIVPEVALLFPAASAARLAGVAVAVACAAAVVPLRRIARLDPAVVFRE